MCEELKYRARQIASDAVGECLLDDCTKTATKAAKRLRVLLDSCPEQDKPHIIEEFIETLLDVISVD